jgi:hypothetical protein
MGNFSQGFVPSVPLDRSRVHILCCGRRSGPSMSCGRRRSHAGHVNAGAARKYHQKAGDFFVPRMLSGVLAMAISLAKPSGLPPGRLQSEVNKPFHKSTTLPVGTGILN